MDLEKINKAYWLEGGREKIKELEAIRDEKIQEELDNIRLKNKIFRTSGKDITVKIINHIIPHYEWLYEAVFDREISYERLIQLVVHYQKISIRNGSDVFGYNRTDPISYRLLGFGNPDEKSWLNFFKKRPVKNWSNIFKFYLFSLAVNGHIFSRPVLVLGNGQYIDMKVLFNEEQILLEIPFHISYEYEKIENMLGFSYKEEMEIRKKESEKIKEIEKIEQEQAAKDELKRLKDLEVQKQKEREERERKVKEELERPIREESELLKKQLFELNEDLNFLTRRIDRNKNDIQKTTKDLKKISGYLAEKKEAYNRISYREKKLFEEFGK